MLSYRHAFHAGNHADVLKHLLLLQLIRHFEQKDKAFWIIDTHAGASLYSLDAGYATKLSEARDGIARLWDRTDLPAALTDYLEQVRALNPDGALKAYPGSPWLAYKTMREQDKLRLFELHSSDSRLLLENFRDAGRQVMITPDDGFVGLKALLPPPTRRGMVLIDPSYETRDDYARVVQGLKDGLERFATGTYAVWYPQLGKIESHQLPEKLKRLPAKSWLHVALTVRAPSPEGIGMHGSGMFVINPPWTLAPMLEKLMPWLTEALAQDGGARYTLEHEEV